MASNDRPGMVRRLVVLLTVMLGATTLAPTAFADQSDPRAADWGVTATAGVDGHVVADTWTPVTVTLEPDEPFRGRILLASGRDGSTSLQSRSVEVAAGGASRYLLLAPPGVDVQVQVVEDGTDEAVTLQPRGDRTDGFLVGVIGSSDAAALPAVTLPMTDQRSTAVVVDEVLLDAGARGLQSLASLVVRQSDLAGLTDQARRAVAARVAEGATLVVTGATDPDLGLPWRAFTERTDAGLVPLPGAWATSAGTLVQPGGDAAPSPAASGDVVAIAAGRGRLVATTLEVGSSGPASDQVFWEHLLQPDDRTLGAEESRRFTDLPGEVERAFGDSAGEPPSFAWLAIFFLVYVLVTGPVIGLVMARRRRPEFAWVVIPLVTAVFAGAAFVGASSARPPVGVAARVATWVDGQGATMAVAGVRSPQAGQHIVTLPGDGWDVANASWGAAARVAVGTDTVVTVNVPSHALGAVVGWQALDREPALDVEVALFGAEARVEVTNTTDHDLDEPTLRLATESHELGDVLPAGETLVQTVPLPDELGHQRDPFGEQFQGPFERRGGPDGLASLARWDLLDGSPGLAVVTATADGDLGLATPAIDGSTPLERGSLVAVGVTPSVTDDTTTPFEVRRDLVAAGRGTWRDMPLTLSGSGPATMRFRLPHEGGVDSLALAMDRDMGQFGPAQPMPAPIERCGLLERRNPETGAVLEATDVCAPEFPCPPDASSCGWTEAEGDDRLEGQACFPDDVCQDLIWTLDGHAQPLQEVPGASGMQVWNHLDRRWVDLPVGDEATVQDEGVGRWLSPLGEVWVRATGELTPFDLAPQGVSAQLGDRG